MNWYHNNMHQKKRLSLTAKILIAIGVIVLGLILVRVTQIALDYQNFHRNEKEIINITASISIQTEPSEVKEKKYCQEVHLKYAEGPKSCYVGRTLYYSTADKKTMLSLAAQNKKIFLSNNIKINAVSDVTESLNRYSEQNYSYHMNGQICNVSFYYYSDESQRILYDSGSKEGDDFRGLVASISCGQGVKWAYYPLR